MKEERGIALCIVHVEGGCSRDRGQSRRNVVVLEERVVLLVVLEDEV